MSPEPFLFVQQNTIQRIEQQPAMNFRNKEAFIVLYDQSSEVHLKNLQNWIKKIEDTSNNPYSIVMVLGHNPDLSNPWAV